MSASAPGVDDRPFGKNIRAPSNRTKTCGQRLKSGAWRARARVPATRCQSASGSPPVSRTRNSAASTVFSCAPPAPTIAVAAAIARRRFGRSPHASCVRRQRSSLVRSARASSRLRAVHACRRSKYSCTTVQSGPTSSGRGRRGGRRIANRRRGDGRGRAAEPARSGSSRMRLAGNPSSAYGTMPGGGSGTAGSNRIVSRTAAASDSATTDAAATMTARPEARPAGAVRIANPHGTPPERFSTIRPAAAPRVGVPRAGVAARALPIHAGGRRSRAGRTLFTPVP